METTAARTQTKQATSPSRWSERVAVAATAILGALIAARLATYQLGWTSTPWEPLFGDGTRQVLDSSFSRSLPFPDAALGVVAYVLEIVTVLCGPTDRFRTDRLAVYAYAAIAFGMALGSVALIVLQLAVLHAFCTLWLGSAFLSFVLVVPARGAS